MSKIGRELTQDRGVLGIVLDVHMTTTGSYERSLENQLKDIQILETVVCSWEKSIFSHGFDTAVLNLIYVTLAEWREYELKRTRTRNT